MRFHCWHTPLMSTSFSNSYTTSRDVVCCHCGARARETVTQGPLVQQYGHGPFHKVPSPQETYEYMDAGVDMECSGEPLPGRKL
jgi:hypothetical protein